MKLRTVTALVAGLLVPTAAFAQAAPAVDISGVSEAFDASIVIAAIVAAGTLMVGIKLAMTGVKYVARIAGRS